MTALLNDIDFDSTDEYSSTLLLWAAEEGLMVLVKLLLADSRRISTSPISWE